MDELKFGQLNSIERLKLGLMRLNYAVIFLLVPLTALLIVLLRWHMIDSQAAFTIGQNATRDYYAVREDIFDDVEATKKIRSNTQSRVIAALVKGDLQTSVGFEQECNLLLNTPLKDPYLPKELRLTLDAMQLDRREQIITVVRHVHDALIKEESKYELPKELPSVSIDVLTIAENKARIIWNVINNWESDPGIANIIAQIASILDLVGPQIDTTLTERLKTIAAENVPAVKRMFESGELIIRKNTLITPDIALLLKRHGYPEGKFPYVSALLSSFVALVCAIGIKITVAAHVPGEKQRSHFLYPCFLLILSWLIQLVVVDLGYNGIGIFPIIVIIYLTLPERQALDCAAAVSLSSAVIVSGVDVNYISVNLLAGFGGMFAGTILLKKNYTRIAVWVHECYLGFIFIFASVALQWGLIGTFDIRKIPSMFLVCLLMSIGVILVLPIMEMFFDVVSPLRLLELTQATHPLLRRLVNEASGTYQHSQMTGNLAEAAAEAIGLNPILLRAGAYFHDIGKLKQPKFFIENQSSGINEHDELSPAMSAMILISHVKDGLALATKYRLPTIIKSFIAEHHGTTCLTYFYKKALKENLNVTESQFCYPGPKPQSKETGLLMLADSIEAAARSNSAGLKRIRDLELLVDEVVQSKLDSGQLDDVQFTFKDLNEIKKAIIQRLRAIYHSRDIKPLSESFPEEKGSKQNDEN